ncbi:AbgT family transporter [Corynebacterium mycetoides]|uniref:AbgT family transporter n=1 Tax=Corynebacterium mycetoides TaxID=38302 RepID=UPI000B88F509|nr:AbgT family transporter [Corynebacterium mycetoides]
MTGSTKATADETRTESAGGFLGAVERIGNKLPDPFWLFVILSGVVVIASVIGNRIGMKCPGFSSDRF